MRIALAILATLSFALPALAEAPRGRPVPSRPAQVIETVMVPRVEFDRRLDKLENLVKEMERSFGQDRRDDRRKGVDRNDVRELKRELAELRQMFREAPITQVDTRPPHPPQPPHHGSAVTSPHELEQIRNAVARESFSRDQLRVLETAVGARRLAVDQSLRLLKVFSFSGDRLKALELMAPRTVDLRERGYVLFEAFDFHTDKEKARRIIERNS